MNTSFLITMISGLSTMLGTVFIFFKIKNIKRMIHISLIFSSLIMLYVSLFDLIPTSFNYLLSYYNIDFSLLILVFNVLFGFIVVKELSIIIKTDNHLYKIGIISMLVLVIHNIPEGIITYIVTSKDMTIGISLAFSIALHNIPEGITISIPIYYSTGNKKKALLYTLFSSIQEPIGALVAHLFLHQINNYIFSLILSVTAGIMIYLSIFEILIKNRRTN